jgi:hypothetical protein
MPCRSAPKPRSWATTKPARSNESVVTNEYILMDLRLKPLVDTEKVERSLRFISFFFFFLKISLLLVDKVIQIAWGMQ